MRDAFALRKLECGAALEFGQHDQRAAQIKEGHDHAAQPADMGPRHADQRALFVTEPEGVAPVQAGMDDAHMRKHRALGLAGRTRGVKDREQSLLVSRRNRWHWITAGDRSPPRGCRHIVARGRCGRCRRDDIGELGSVDDCRRVAICTNIVQFGRARTGADRHQNRPQPQDRHHRPDRIDPVGEHHRDPVTDADASRREQCGQRARLRKEVGVAQSFIALDHSDRSRPLRRDYRHPFRKVGGAFGVASHHAIPVHLGLQQRSAHSTVTIHDS